MNLFKRSGSFLAYMEFSQKGLVHIMRQRKKHLIFSLLLLLLITLLIGCSRLEGKKKDGREFDKFVDEIFRTEVQKDSLTLNYSLAHPKNYGITEPKVSLGHYSVDYLKDMLVSSENYLARLEEYDYNSLSDSQKLTYDILKMDLGLEKEMGDLILYNEILGPTTGIQAQLPVLLAEYTFYEKDDIETYLALLPKVQDYFDEIIEFEKEKSAAGLFMSDEVADSIIEQCEAFIADKENNYLIDVFNDKIKSYKGLTKEEITSYMEANEKAVTNNIIPAYENLVFSLTQLKGSGTNDGGLCYYDRGKEFYEYLIKTNTGSSKSVPELKKMLDENISKSMLKLTSLLMKDPTLADTVLSITYPLTDPSEIIEYLETAIKKDFPATPAVSCSIKYVHESLREHLSPAMYLIPPIDNYKDNVIYINNNPSYDLSQIFTTIAHEGYPGHLYQSVFFRNLEPAPIRSLLNFGGYVEGWATYVEYYSYYLAGFDKNVAEFLEASMSANMALYCRLDIGIHYEGWSLAETASYLKSFGINDTTTVKLLYQTMIEEPALYPQYGIGYLEFLELRETAEKALGDKFVLKDFHEFLLNLGPAQFDIIAGRLETWIEGQK